MEANKITTNDTIISMLANMNADKIDLFYQSAENYANSLSKSGAFYHRIKRLISEKPMKFIQLDNLPNDLKKLIQPIINKSSINPNKKVNEITKEERRRLVKLLKEFIIEIKGFRPIEEAIITSGGINIKEINPKTMESKKIKGLYFAGEIIDVDAYTGGFNLQIAYSTGYVAGMTHEGQV